MGSGFDIFVVVEGLLMRKLEDRRLGGGGDCSESRHGSEGLSVGERSEEGSSFRSLLSCSFCRDS